MVVPCGRCEACIQRKRADWTIRLLTSEKICSNAYFITLTYSDKNLPFDVDGIIERGLDPCRSQPVVLKSDLQDLFKRYRKKVGKTDLQYYAVGEYGTHTLRPHYHLIVFNVDLERFLEAWTKGQDPIGRVHVGKVTKQSVNYVTSYVVNKYKYDKRKKYPPFSLMSKGIGKQFVTDEMKKYFKSKFTSVITTEGGEKYALPRYLRDKIYCCETSRRLIGAKSRMMAQKDLKDLDYKEIIDKRIYERVIFNRNKKFKI